LAYRFHRDYYFPNGFIVSCAAPATSNTHACRKDCIVTTKTMIRKHSSFLIYNFITPDENHVG
jgi:hypothetical protein